MQMHDNHASISNSRFPYLSEFEVDSERNGIEIT